LGLAEFGTRLEDLVDILSVIGIAVDRKFQIGNLKFKHFVDGDVLGFVSYDHVNFFLKHFKDINILVDLGDVLLRVSTEIGESLHESDENDFDVTFWVDAFTTRGENSLKHVQMELIWES